MTDQVDYDEDDSLEELMQTQERDIYSYQIQAFEEEEDETALAAAGVVLYVDQETFALRNARRARTRQYLSRADLLPDPRVNTPWLAMYERQDTQAFITTMSFDPATFQLILDSGFSEIWNATPIYRSDTNTDGVARVTRRSLDAAGALGLLLHYLSSTMLDVSLCQIFALIPVSIHRYITFALPLLLQVLRRMPEARVQFPRGLQFQEQNELIVARHPLLTGAFGSMDGLNVPVEVSNDEYIENATFNGWLHAHCVSSVFAFAADGTIIACNLNAPGSWHDSRVAQPIFLKLRNCTPEGYYLVTDSAFPQAADEVEAFIRAPLKQGDHLPDDAQKREDILAFNRQLISYRQTAEWGMHALQGAFGRLRMPLSIHFKSQRAHLLETVTRLHNLRTRCVGINQIRSVYMPMWTEDEEFLIRLGNMMFADIRKNDRVMRFHVEAVQVRVPHSNKK